MGRPGRRVGDRQGLRGWRDAPPSCETGRGVDRTAPRLRWAPRGAPTRAPRQAPTAAGGSRHLPTALAGPHRGVACFAGKRWGSARAAGRQGPANGVLTRESGAAGPHDRERHRKPGGDEPGALACGALPLPCSSLRRHHREGPRRAALPGVWWLAGFDSQACGEPSPRYAPSIARQSAWGPQGARPEGANGRGAQAPTATPNRGDAGSSASAAPTPASRPPRRRGFCALHSPCLGGIRAPVYEAGRLRSTRSVPRCVILPEDGSPRSVPTLAGRADHPPPLTDTPILRLPRVSCKALTVPRVALS